MASAQALERALRKKREIIMLELPTEQYFQATVQSIRTLTKKGYEGIYVSFQRPFKNLVDLLKREGIPTNKLVVIDAAAAVCKEEPSLHPRCVHVSPSVDIDELIRALYLSLPKIKGKNKFIYIDSLTTIALYKPLSEIMRFCLFLSRSARSNKEFSLLLFTVAKDLAQKKFIQDIALEVDEVV